MVRSFEGSLAGARRSAQGARAAFEAEDRLAFVRAHTELCPPPLVPELRLYTATAVTSLWQATATWLASREVDVPFWSVPWAGGQALARFVLDHPELVRGRRVVDVGSGSGLVALAAVRAGATDVCALDVDPLAEAAARANATANGLALDVVCADLTGAELEADIVLAGDVWYEREAAGRFETWFRDLAAAGARVLTGDPGRSYVPKDARELARYEVPTPLELESTPVRATRVLEVEAARNVPRAR